MKHITLDYETFYSADYSLRKMTPVEYILDPRFETIGCAVKEGDGKAFWLTEGELVAYLAGYKRSKERVAMVSHNALFDMCITAWRYDFTPHIMIDTLGLSRAWLGHKLRSHSLASVAAHLGIGAKGGTVHKVQGMGLAAIKASGFYDEYAEYSCNDAALCWDIYRKIMAQGFPVRELAVMDTVLRCAVQPSFVLNQEMLHRHLHVTQEAKASLMSRVGMTSRDDLMSNDRFAEALRALGVEPPTKVSLTTGKETYAFAKTDADFMDLEEHDDPSVQALVSARLGVKSTIEETRTDRLISISNLNWPDGRHGVLPMALRYSGAHTHRLSGDWKLNCMHPDVEVLTPVGWERIADWQPETPVMQWWPNGRLTFDTSAGKVEKSVDEDIVWFDAPFVQGGFTQDHRMVHYVSGRAVDKTAGWIAGHSGLDNIPVAGMFQGTDAPLLTPDQVRLMVALAADGSELTETGRRLLGGGREPVKRGGWQWGFHKQRKADRLRALLTACGIPFNETSSGKRTSFVVRGSKAPTWLHKGFGPWCLMLSADGMDALLDEIVHWDGFRNSRSGATIFCTSKRPEADWVQTVAHLRGMACTVRQYVRKTAFGHTAQYYTYFRQSVTSSVGNGQARKQAYSGRVYCPQVASSYVLARFGTGVFVTGNCQNLPSRGNTALRDSMEAPKGYKVVGVDASQIEARGAADFCGQTSMVNAFANKEDIYSTFASSVFGYEVNKKAHPVQRFIGKTAVLGLQYNLGWPKFQKTVAMQSKAQVGEEVMLSDEEAARVVQLYRTTYSAIPAMWQRLQKMLPKMTQRGLEEWIGPVKFEFERILLPSGLYLSYNELRCEDNQWRFTYGGKTKYIYGGKMLENIIQALARICVMDAAVRIRNTYGYQLKLQVHDELVYIVPEADAETVMQNVIKEMRVRPSWAPNLPLDAEGGIGPSFGQT